MCLIGLKFLIVSHHIAKFSGHGSCDSSDITAKIFFGDFARPCDQRIWLLYGRKLIIVYPNTVKIGCHRHCVNERIIILVCPVILQKPRDYKVI